MLGQEIKNLSHNLLLVGGGGHCKSVVDSLLTLNTYDRIGIVDIDATAGTDDIPVVGTDDDLPKLLSAGWTEAFVAVGSVANTNSRRRIYEMLKSMGFTIPIIMDPSAIMAKNADIGEGTYIGKGAIINTRTVIGACAIINTGVIIEHDCVIGDLSHISTGSMLCGQVTVGSDSHIGAGSAIRQCINIGDKTVIGAGSAVVKDIPGGVTAFGNPCRVVG